MISISLPFNPHTAFGDFSVVDISGYEHLQQILANYSRISYYSSHCPA